jgi:hypothetical protein
MPSKFRLSFSLSLTRSFARICLKQKTFSHHGSSKDVQAFEHLLCHYGLKRYSFLHRKTWQLQKYFDFHELLLFFCFRHMRENERVRRAEFAWHLVLLWYNDCCIIKPFIPNVSYLKQKFWHPLSKDETFRMQCAPVPMPEHGLRSDSTLEFACYNSVFNGQ